MFGRWLLPGATPAVRKRLHFERVRRGLYDAAVNFALSRSRPE